MSEKKPISTSELIAAVGDENVGVQNLDQCAIAWNWSQKKGTRIEFGSDAKIMPGGGTEKLGLIVWMPRDRVKQVLKAHNERPSHE